jgi:hypothetical protein
MQKSKLCLLLMAGLAFGQTQVDLRTQSKGVDFTGAPITKPFRIGNGLPASCLAGEFFYNTAIADQNLYGCTSSNTWKAIGSSSAVLLQDFLADLPAPNLLRIGASCSTQAPCSARFGSTVYKFQEGASVTVSAGSGLVLVYLTSKGTLTVGYDTLSLTCSANCTAISGIQNFPPNTIPLVTWPVVNGSWVDGAGIDYRAFLAAYPILTGSGVLAVDNGTSLLIQVDPSSVPRVVKNTVSLTIPAITAGTCASDQSINLASAAVGDTVAPGWPSNLPTGIVGLMWVQTADTVAMRLCNVTSSTITPGAGQYATTIFKGF